MFAIGLKLIKRFCQEQDPMKWQRAKLSPELFSKYEIDCFSWVSDFVKMNHALPHIETLSSQFPDLGVVDVPEPSSHYLTILENKFYYNVINEANVKSQEILKNNQDAHEKALEILQNAHKTIKSQKYRSRILDVGKELPNLVIGHYNSIGLVEKSAKFGWKYLDDQGGGVLSGEVVSTIGRPALGKTWLELWIALQNWRDEIHKKNVIFVSMEMSVLPIAQRIAAMYTGCTIQQLKKSGFADKTYKKFVQSIAMMKNEEAKFYVVDGNLAATVEDIFTLADMLECQVVVIDGGYLLRHPNFKLDRYTRVAENAELIKRYSVDQSSNSFVSWQFAKTASKKKEKNEEVSLDDIAYSDAIGQISSIVLGLFQEEGVETLNSRKIKVLKGRNGETGQFTIAWDFVKMLFQQVDPDPNSDSTEEKEPAELEYL